MQLRVGLGRGRLEGSGELPTLPFTYVRTNDPEQAAYWHHRSPRWRHEPFSDQEIQEMVTKQHEAKQWYTTAYWRAKGPPTEQFDMTFGEQSLTLYNFDNEVPVTDEHLDRTANVIRLLSSKFPTAIEKLKWFMINGESSDSFYAEANKHWRSIWFYRDGMRLSSYSMPGVSVFEGVMAHEIAHLIEDEFKPAWEQSFKWGFCRDYPSEWEVRETPEGKSWFNKKSNMEAAHGQFPFEPDQCVSWRAALDMREDIAESVAAYLYNPESLQQISPEKYRILAEQDRRSPLPQIVISRVAKSEIKLPEIQPATVLYHIQESL